MPRNMERPRCLWCRRLACFPDAQQAGRLHHNGQTVHRLFLSALMLIEHGADFLELSGGQLAVFDQMGDQVLRGTVEDAVEQLAEHAAGGGLAGDAGFPEGRARSRLADDKALVEHDLEHCGDSGGSDLAALEELSADLPKL